MAWLVSDGRVLASAEIAAERSDRNRGLLGRDEFEGALILNPCRWIHTMGMRFALDVAYIDEAGVVVATVTMRPNRMGVPRLRATMIIEAQAGAFGRWGLHLGDTIEIRE